MGSSGGAALPRGHRQADVHTVSALQHPAGSGPPLLTSAEGPALRLHNAGDLRDLSFLPEDLLGSYAQGVDGEGTGPACS